MPTPARQTQPPRPTAARSARSRKALLSAAPLSLAKTLARNLTELTRVLRDPELDTTLLQDLGHALAGNPEGAQALSGVISVFYGDPVSLPLPESVPRLAEIVAELTDALDQHLLSEEADDSVRTWLTMTALPTPAVRIAIGWLEEGLLPGEEMTSITFKEGTYPCEHPVLTYLLVSALSDFPEYLGYDETIN